MFSALFESTKKRLKKYIGESGGLYDMCLVVVICLTPYHGENTPLMTYSSLSFPARRQESACML